MSKLKDILRTALHIVLGMILLTASCGLLVSTEWGRTVLVVLTLLGAALAISAALHDPQGGDGI